MTLSRLPLLAEAAIALVAARVMVALVPMGRLVKGLSHADPPQAGPGSAVTGAPSAVAWAVGRATRLLPWTSTCLMRGLAGQWMLARRGIASTLHFGVAKAGEGAMAAHAWLEAEGAIILGGEEAAGFAAIAGLRRGGSGSTPP